MRCEIQSEQPLDCTSLLIKGIQIQGLQQTIEIYRKIIHTLPDLIWLKSSEGVYLAANPQFEALIGASEQEIIGKTDCELTHARWSEISRKRDSTVILTGAPSIHEEWVHYAKSVRQELLEISRFPVHDDDGHLLGVLGIGRNVTARRQSEARLLKSEERFSLAMRGANDGLWDWNLETNEVYYSPRWKSMLGYVDGELTDDLKTWKSLVHPSDREKVLAMVQDYILGQIDGFDIEMRMQHKLGHDVFVLSRAFLVHRESDGKAVRLVGTHVDITARKKAEVFNDKHAEIMEMIATGKPASEIYVEIALMYEGRHPGLRCSMLELQEGRLMHGGAPSLPKEYCDAVHGLKNGPNVGSCGTSTYTGQRVLVEDIATDPKWADIKHVALPHGMRCCWSEPIKSSSGLVLGAFGMYYNYPALPDEEESNDLMAAARLAGIVMERDHAQKRIRQLAYSDDLTGLASRAHFYERLGTLISGCEQTHSRLALLYIDLDDFKSVNDSLGHDAGDVLLREIAQRLKTVTSDTDFVARLGGDEFCILVRKADDDATGYAVHLAQRCLEMLSSPLELSARKFTPTCSIGIAHYPDDGRDISTLVKAADTSLYAAKERGKNQYACCDSELTRAAEYRFRMEHHLREAIETQQLSLVYQPQVQVSTGKIVGVEVLSRWYHPQLGQVPPQEFIPTAERIGMIKPLTEWVLTTACQQAVAWRTAGLPPVRIAVNISPIHFLCKDFVSLIRQVLDETGMEPSLLELEVTESVVQTNPQNLSVFQSLKELGIMLAIDDFGTGYSSFASLKHIAVDYLKIDKYFIDDLLEDQKSQLLVNAMVEMGHKLGHTLIAEGVETSEQYQTLQHMDCEIIQGYLLSQPIGANEIAQMLQGNASNSFAVISE